MNRALSQAQTIRKPAARGGGGVVVSQNRIASEIGAQVLREGGNAVDAAVAVSFALGAVEPWMSGIGGGGYMILRRAGDETATVVDFGMRSPRGLQESDYAITGGAANDLFPWPRVKDDANITGARAVAIPGTVAGMALAHEHFCTRPWADLLAPAIAEARRGLYVDWYCQLMLSGAARDLSRFAQSRAVFLDAEGFPRSSAWTALGQSVCDLSNLAATLNVLATEGAEAFYCGSLTPKIVADLNAEGGRHHVDDFASYQAAIVPASKTSYRGHHVFSTPKLTAGPTLERVLQLLSAWHPKDKPDAAAYIAYDQAIRSANAERYGAMGDTGAEQAPSCTSHFNVVDRDGTTVAVTQTLLSVFGSRLMLPSTGILMNNGIMWFDPEPGKPNSIGPDKRCLSNMAPTLLERQDGHRFALGASGGRKIMPAVAQLVSYLLDYEMDLDAAMHSPRIDCSLDDVTIADAALPADILAALKAELASVIPAPRTTYPYNYACPSIAEHAGGQGGAIAETMAPWAEAVAA